MKTQQHFAAAVAAVVVTVWFAYYNSGVGPSDAETSLTLGVNKYVYEAVPIEHAVGPESFAFDPRGEGPYTGVSDGRIIKWHRPQNRWLDFALTSSHRWEWLRRERLQIKDGMVLYYLPVEVGDTVGQIEVFSAFSSFNRFVMLSVSWLVG